MTGPLEGLLVADFSRVLAGPMATATLADLGARVVKVERPGIGDDTRHWGPPWTPRSSSYFECANRSKESIELDLKDEEDRAVAHELVRRADVVVENYRTGVLERFGLGYAAVSAVNPSAVYCSITGFGSGRGAALPGYDFIVQAVGGLMSITGQPGGEPTKAGVAVVDILTGKDAVVGILAALADRHRTGRGQHVEVSLLSSLLGSLANQVGGFLATGTPPGLMGNQHPSIAPYETLHCRDGVLAVSCGNDAQFARLTVALGLPDAASDPRFQTNAARVKHRREMVDLLEGTLRRDDVDTWVAAITEAGVPAGRVGDIGSAINLARDLGLEPVVDLGPGHMPQIRSPLTFSRSTVRSPTPPPNLGEHTRKVRTWLTHEPGRHSEGVSS